MTEFEQRYRSLLRVLPLAYGEMADDTVATFLEGMATGVVEEELRIGRGCMDRRTGSAHERVVGDSEHRMLFWSAGSISSLPVAGGVKPADPLPILGNLAELP